jgi:hypothetical protein
MEKLDNQEKEQEIKEEPQIIEDEEKEISDEEDKDTKDEKNSKVSSENQPHFTRHFLNKSKTTRQKVNYTNIGKSIKSGASSFTNDSSLNNDQLSSSRDSEEKRRTRRIFDIEYPSLKRCHSTKKYHYSKEYKDIIKEEKNEDENDSFCSFISNRSKFSSYTIMPKDNLFFFEKKKLFDENNIKPISSMEPVPETTDENLIFQKPKIQILSDRKEDSKLNVIPNSTLNVKKTPLDENEVIQEVKELDGIFDEEFDQKLDSIKIKYKSFYDKEEPPVLFSGLQGECKPFNDEVPDEIEEADFEDDAKEVIRKNSMIIQRKKNIADEIDNDFKKGKKLTSKFGQIKEQKGFIDEKDELNNKEDNEEKEEKEEEKEKDEEKEEESNSSDI